MVGFECKTGWIFQLKQLQDTSISLQARGGGGPDERGDGGGQDQAGQERLRLREGRQQGRPGAQQEVRPHLHGRVRPQGQELSGGGESVLNVRVVVQITNRYCRLDEQE